MFPKIIKTDSVINITTAYTEIFPKADIKKNDTSYPQKTGIVQRDA